MANQKGLRESFKGLTAQGSIPLKPTSGPSIGNVGTNKLTGGLKKGAVGIPTIKKS
jgi:hypothetical protein